MTRIRISEDALQDLNEGFLFYEAQERGLGDYFISSIRSDIEKLKISAGVHRIVYKDFHRLLGSTFPYGVFYTYSEGMADIWAVIDLRQDPVWIRSHLAGKG
jgi:hypothetical protein